MYNYLTSAWTEKVQQDFQKKSIWQAELKWKLVFSLKKNKKIGFLCAPSPMIVFWQIFHVVISFVRSSKTQTQKQDILKVKTMVLKKNRKNEQEE